MQTETHQETQAQTQTEEATATRTAGVYLLVAKDAGGDLYVSEYHSRKEFKKAVNDLLAAGGEILKGYRGARGLELKVQSVASF